MTVGLTIPGVPVVHPRESWQEPGFRMELDFTRLPDRYVASNVTRGAIHYSSAMNLPDGDIGEFAYQIIPWLRNSQRDYLVNRKNGGYTRRSDGRYFPGYHLGYSWMVDWLGGAWEVRGFDFRPAATNGHNSNTVAIMLITDRHDHASMLAWATVRALLREAKRRSGRDDFHNRPWGHGEFHANTGIGTPTICPGPPNLAQIHMGLGDLDYGEGDDTMGALTGLPEGLRAYDSRPGQPTAKEFHPHNGMLPRVPMRAGESRRVVCGAAVQAGLNVTSIRASGAGAGGTVVSAFPEPPDPASPSSTTNHEHGELVDSNYWITALEAGACWIHCFGTPDFAVDVAIDVTARG